MADRRAKEESLESLLFNHPYLLNPSLTAASRFRRQYSYAGGRVDIVLRNRGRAILVECKRTQLTERDFAQLHRYVIDLQDELCLGRMHYLVGLVAPDSPRQRRFADGVRVRIIGIGREIPRRLVLGPLGRYSRAPAGQEEGVYTLNF